MTNEEAAKMLTAKVDCMERENSGTDLDCDECELCYAQGTLGEQIEALKVAIDALERQIPQKTQKDLQPTCNNLATDCISRQAAIDTLYHVDEYNGRSVEAIRNLPSAQSEEVTPHRNYKYLSDYWCECGNHLGKKGSVTFCSDCGRKVKWDE